MYTWYVCQSVLHFGALTEQRSATSQCIIPSFQFLSFQENNGLAAKILHSNSGQTRTI
jgi:hypothetical protein